jgi:hypothetical protein
LTPFTRRAAACELTLFVVCYNLVFEWPQSLLLLFQLPQLRQVRFDVLRPRGAARELAGSRVSTRSRSCVARFSVAAVASADIPEMKLFNKWNYDEVVVSDISLEVSTRRADRHAISSKFRFSSQDYLAVKQKTRFRTMLPVCAVWMCWL